MRIALGIAVGAVIVLMGFTLAVHGLGMMASPGQSDNFYSANDGLNDFKMKMAQIIEGANQGKENLNGGIANGLDDNVLGANSSDVNRSADNQSAHDLTIVNPIPFKSTAPNTGAFNSSDSIYPGLTHRKLSSHDSGPRRILRRIHLSSINLLKTKR